MNRMLKPLCSAFLIFSCLEGHASTVQTCNPERYLFEAPFFSQLRLRTREGLGSHPETSLQIHAQDLLNNAALELSQHASLQSLFFLLESPGWPREPQFRTTVHEQAREWLLREARTLAAKLSTRAIQTSVSPFMKIRAYMPALYDVGQISRVFIESPTVVFVELQTSLGLVKTRLEDIDLGPLSYEDEPVYINERFVDAVETKLSSHESGFYRVGGLVFQVKSYDTRSTQQHLLSAKKLTELDALIRLYRDAKTVKFAELDVFKMDVELLSASLTGHLLIRNVKVQDLRSGKIMILPLSDVLVAE